MIETPQAPEAPQQAPAQPEGAPVYDISGQEPVLGSLPHDQVQAAVASGKYSLPQGEVHVISPEGELGTLPAEQAPEAFKSGYQYATPDVVKSHEMIKKYGTPSQQLIAGLEGVAGGIGTQTLATALEKGVGVDEQDILGREKVNPWTHGIGQVAGLVSGVGEGALLGKVGEAAAGLTKAGEAANYAREAAEAAGLAPKAIEAAAKEAFSAQPLFARVGSSAVQQAAEMAVLEGDNEVHKMILNDPETSSQLALANIGMAAALGGATGAFVTGAISPLWKAAVGDKAEQLLGRVVSKFGGTQAGENAQGLAEQVGINAPNEIKAVLDDAPNAAEMASKLDQTDTTFGGKKYQESREQFQSDLTNKTLETLGRDPSVVENPIELDKYNRGKDLGNELHKSLKPQIDEVSESYDKFNEKFKASEVSSDNMRGMADKISDLAIKKGFNKAESDAQMNLVNRVLEKLPLQTTAEDIKTFISNLRKSHPWGSDTYYAAKDIAGILAEGQGRAVSEGIISKGGNAVEAANLLKQYKGLQSKYSQLMTTLDTLNDHLHVGSYEGPGTFLKALKEKSETNGEAILRSLSGQNKASVLDLLSQVSPETLQKVQDYHIDKLISDAGQSKGGVSAASLMRKLNDKNMSPQIRQLITKNPQNEQLFGNVQKILDKMFDPTHNWSNTARTADKLTYGIPTPLTLIASLMGHGGDALLAYLGKMGFTEGGDAVRLGVLKLMGSDQPVKSESLKAAISLMHNTIKGESMLAKGAEAVFKRGAQVLAEKNLPSKDSNQKLDKIVTKSLHAPDSINPDTSKTAYYMPGHGAALSATTAQAIQYLKTLKPQEHQLTPLDAKIQPTGAQEARYNRALTIANNPMTVLQHVKDGTIQPSDIKDLQAMYPAVYAQMAKQLTSEMANSQSEESTIPYSTRMGLSLFLGHPLDSTMNPASIMAAQPKQNLPNQPQQGPKQKNSTSKLGKTNAQYLTPNQAAEAHKAQKD